MRQFLLGYYFVWVLICVRNGKKAEDYIWAIAVINICLPLVFFINSIIMAVFYYSGYESALQGKNRLISTAVVAVLFYTIHQLIFKVYSVSKDCLDPSKYGVIVNKKTIVIAYGTLALSILFFVGLVCIRHL